MIIIKYGKEVIRMIKPLYNNVLLKKVEASNETKSGIIISQKETNEEFAVVAEVSGCKEVKVDDKVYEMPLKKGDKVMYKKYSGTDVKDGEQEYILIKAEDILAIVK
jgi:chaperonin GroES